MQERLHLYRTLKKALMYHRLTILLIALSPVLPLFGQISLGASIGGLLSTPKAHISDQSLQINIPAQRKLGFTAGLHVDMPLGESGFRMMPTLRYADKGFLARTEVAVQQTKVVFDISHRMGFIELGIPFGLATELGDHAIFFGVGPYVALATAGRMKTSVSINGITDEQSEPISFGSGAGGYDRLDYGAELSAGFVFSSGLFLKAGYIHGIPDLSNDQSNPLRQRCATLSVGYFFLR
jgi:hypothetical protein